MHRILHVTVQVSHPGSGSDRTIASERQETALAMLYIGRLVTCGIDYSFTPQTNFLFLHEKNNMSVFLV